MLVTLLIVHIASGSLALVAGPAAMLAPKRRGWHTRAGIGYQVLMALVCASAIGLAALRPALWWLGLIAVATWAVALAGWWMRRRQPRGWLPWHISFMCGSYTSLATAVLVVNAGIGNPVAWLLPTVVATPLIARRAFRAAGRPGAAHPGPPRRLTQG